MDPWTYKITRPGATPTELLLGAGTPYQIAPDGIDGLGVPAPRVTDVSRHPADGSDAGFESLPPRLLTFPIQILGDTVAETVEAWRTLSTLWSPHPAGEVALTLAIPGYPDGGLTFYGRPRGLVDDGRRLTASPPSVDVLATFVALDPIGYGPAVTAQGSRTSAGSIDLPITNAGNIATDRLSVTLRHVDESAGNSGGYDTIRVLNLTTGGSVRVLEPFALFTDQTVDIDLRRRTVRHTNSVGTVADWYPNLKHLPDQWFTLAPGASVIRCIVDLISSPANTFEAEVTAEAAYL